MLAVLMLEYILLFVNDEYVSVDMFSVPLEGAYIVMSCVVFEYMKICTSEHELDWMVDEWQALYDEQYIVHDVHDGVDGQIM